MSSGSSYVDFTAFSTIMATKYPEYGWNTITTYAADEAGNAAQYELTNFKIWNKQKRDDNKPWIFFQHGGTMSGTNWITMNSKTGKSPFVELADLGYDVYIGNNRGQLVSSNHKSLAYDSEAYWSYTLDGYALDVLANMRDVYLDSGLKKGYYFGYSLGTV